MPIYNDNIGELGYLTEPEVWKMYNTTKDKYKQLFLSLAWLTGARPSEILLLTRKDFIIESNKITIFIPTLKLRTSKDFQIKKRKLVFGRPTGLGDEGINPYIETIVGWYQLFRVEDIPILPYTRSWCVKIINKAGKEALGRQVTPYHLRHSAITREAASNHSIDQLMHFKGAKSVRSVMPYLHATPYVVMMEAKKKEEMEYYTRKAEERRLAAQAPPPKPLTPYEEYLAKNNPTELQPKKPDEKAMTPYKQFLKDTK
jgi:integrase